MFLNIQSAGSWLTPANQADMIGPKSAFTFVTSY